MYRGNVFSNLFAGPYLPVDPLGGPEDEKVSAAKFDPLWSPRVGNVTRVQGHAVDYLKREIPTPVTT